MLHQLHKVNLKYSYDSLQNLVNRLNPEVILTEIRSEDMNRDSVYLASNYPYEMYMVRNWFPNARIEGFDWLGKELEGRPVSANYWKDSSWVIKLQGKLNQDSAFKEKAASCYLRKGERDSILKNAGLNEIIHGQNHAIVKEQYECFKNVSIGTAYHALSDFYEERNDSILANIRTLIKKFPGKRIVILTGDDHYQLLRDRFTHDQIR